MATDIERAMDVLLEELDEMIPVNGSYLSLLESYLLLMLTKGTDTTVYDVHYAWWIWSEGTVTSHPAWKPFMELPLETQIGDVPYRDAIRRGAKRWKGRDTMYTVTLKFEGADGRKFVKQFEAGQYKGSSGALNNAEILTYSLPEWDLRDGDIVAWTEAARMGNFVYVRAGKDDYVLVDAARSPSSFTDDAIESFLDKGTMEIIGNVLDVRDGHYAKQR